LRLLSPTACSIDLAILLFEFLVKVPMLTVAFGTHESRFVFAVNTYLNTSSSIIVVGEITGPVVDINAMLIKI
jgi:hypothetical protein